MPFVSSSSTTDDDKEEEGDITDFEIGDYSVIDTVNRDQADIEPSDKIIPDSALDNTLCNYICEYINEVGSSSYVINNPPLINDIINEASSSKHSITTNSYFTSEANAIYLVLGCSSEMKYYDMETVHSNWGKLRRILLSHKKTLKVNFSNKFCKRLLH